MTTPLTPREADALRLAAEGRTDKGIARELRISAHTVSHLIYSARHKLGADSRAHAVAIAMRLGIVE